MNHDDSLRDARRLSLRHDGYVSVYAMWWRLAELGQPVLEFFSIRFTGADRADLDGFEGHRIASYRHGVEVLRPRLEAPEPQQAASLEVLEGDPN